jgi:hypothetical protein
MINNKILVLLLVILGAVPGVQAKPLYEMSRGELLYSTQCRACHSTQLHWRDKKLVKDWSSLKVEVRHWEKFSTLMWTEDDVTSVTHYLNFLYYHYSTPTY